MDDYDEKWSDSPWSAPRYIPSPAPKAETKAQRGQRLARERSKQAARDMNRRAFRR